MPAGARHCTSPGDRATAKEAKPLPATAHRPVGKTDEHTQNTSISDGDREARNVESRGHKEIGVIWAGRPGNPSDVLGHHTEEQ